MEAKQNKTKHSFEDFGKFSQRNFWMETWEEQEEDTQNIMSILGTNVLDHFMIFSKINVGPLLFKLFLFGEVILV